MKRFRTAVLGVLAILVSSHAAVHADSAIQGAARIDQLVQANYKKQKVTPNGPTRPEVFLRRVYLDIVGRIPTYDEATRFLNSRDPKKREKLIDELLNSPGYVSHNFNYWADVLRARSRERRWPGQMYVDWIKEQVEKNTPYDDLVYELLMAEGYVWDNPASGYYLRDPGMPLDNMSNTAQVFLGTQLVCAQCHDHPFDVWTQREYYEMAAFTYGVQTRSRDRRLGQLRQRVRREMNSKGEGSDQAQSRMIARAAQRVLTPLAFKVNETPRTLRLPKDYKYDDAKPRSRVTATTIFGDDVELKSGESKVQPYAEWMVSRKNPRFTLVIANRMWKKVFGVGLIEPVDDIKEDTVASNPELMDYLVQQMQTMNYDLKQFQQMLFNTNVYQREASRHAFDPGKPYHFPGPVLRRLSAEQLWDSFLTMAVPDIDERKGFVPTRYDTDKLKTMADADPDELYDLIMDTTKVVAGDMKMRQGMQAIRKQMKAAQQEGDNDKLKQLRKKMQSQRQGMMRRENRRRPPESDPRWKGYPREAVRASEIQSPAPPGHFLRQFGQSDREVIENANRDGSVPQVLTLLNGPMLQQLFSSKAVLAREFENAKSDRDRLNIIYMGILTRKPTGSESSYLLGQMKRDKDLDFEDVAYALVNTKQFMFVQ